MTLNRPVLLELSGGELALALGASDTSVWFYHRDKSVRAVAHKRLQGLWTGRCIALWRVPNGFSKPLSEGDRSAAVQNVAELFARLDHQQTPLADDRYTAALAQRVRLFQRDHDLDDDGVVGVQTLQALNIALGLSPDNVSARAQLAAHEGE
ncbi:MAG: hypothetical protein CSA53_05065 [Gammaproteobacteria bacterium]|nr:MAG: hypothetical protein CSA53_05065 [Gammaproteobacteria bacterium]